ESGGQESDAGTIDGIPVVGAIKSGSRIVYTLERQPTFRVGDQVITQIDWQRRYALMKLHFAAEVILELFTQKFANIQKVGAHISADKSRIDFEWPESITPLLAEFQQRAQAVIDSDAEIESAFSDEGQERRYWKVEGFAQVPCGGTHLKRTSEVGRIALKRKNVGKGKERVEITLVN
ncbi:TPA: alanyl-tRNA editing protein, partial [Vibrio parahaemolyticus]|nr:alanyl-tRNA editing protein [Vibrio parahaemolyticus]